MASTGKLRFNLAATNGQVIATSLATVMQAALIPVACWPPPWPITCCAGSPALGLGTREELVVAKTIRKTLLGLPGRLTRSARRWRLQLPRDWPWARWFTMALARLRCIRSRPDTRRPSAPHPAVGPRGSRPDQPCQPPTRPAPAPFPTPNLPARARPGDGQPP
jgi:hypothetical protein